MGRDCSVACAVSDVVGEEDAEFGRILTAIRDAMREIVPGRMGRRAAPAGLRR